VDKQNALPKISVVMPAYNAEEYIAQAIDSVLAQSYTDFEFIIINDGSQDGTLDIISGYDDERIVLIDNEQNMGITGSLNRGLNVAKGEYIARMDADDVSLPHRFEKQFAYMTKHQDVYVLGSAVCDIDESGKVLGAFFPPSEPAVLGFVIMYRFPFYHPALMIRQSVIDKYDLRYDDEFGKGVEDFHFISRISKYGKLANLDEVLLLFRQHGGSVTANNQERQRVNLHAVGCHNIGAMFGGDAVFNQGDVCQDAEVFSHLLLRYVEQYDGDVSTLHLRAVIGAYLLKQAIKYRDYKVLWRFIVSRKFCFWPFFLRLPAFVYKRKCAAYRIKKLR
jgi:glycosyltransferase involved in cell wall biosynthesis